MKIQVISKIDEGSTFSFTLAFKKTEVKTEEETEVLELDPEFKYINILVAEDMVLNQLLIKTLLDDFGFKCDIAANGKIAIKKLQAKLYDIILMDLQMPEMNGIEATRYIRDKMESQIPIIALTADVTTFDLQKCNDAGMNDYISKPINEKQLYNKIVNQVKKTTVAEKASKIIDLTYFKKHTKNNKKLLLEMIEIYLQQTPPMIDNMKMALNIKIGMLCTQHHIK